MKKIWISCFFSALSLHSMGLNDLSFSIQLTPGTYKKFKSEIKSIIKRGKAKENTTVRALKIFKTFFLPDNKLKIPQYIISQADIIEDYVFNKGVDENLIKQIELLRITPTLELWQSLLPKLSQIGMKYVEDQSSVCFPQLRQCFKRESDLHKEFVKTNNAISIDAQNLMLSVLLFVYRLQSYKEMIETNHITDNYMKNYLIQYNYEKSASNFQNPEDICNT